jgi:hypothetical protein
MSFGDPAVRIKKSLGREAFEGDAGPDQAIASAVYYENLCMHAFSLVVMATVVKW